jgi:glucosamine-6-phosphate deaminase
MKNNKLSLEQIFAILPEDISKNTNLDVTMLNTPEETFFDFARVFVNEIKKNNSAGKHTVAIMPVGPVEPYTTIVRIINDEKINCKNVIIVNMDEYCTEDGLDFIPISNRISFRRFMNNKFYSLIEPGLNILEKNRIFPDPKHPEDIAKIIKEFGGVDICIGSLGYTGHIAFNDPPEPNEKISAEEFKNLPTRVVKLTRETIVQNSLNYSGNFDIVPGKAITLGMKEILSSKKIIMYFMREWQSAVLRKAILGPVGEKFPGSFLQEHNNIKFIFSKNAAKIPLPE